MGRPIKKKFFGNLYNNEAALGSGVGGESVATVTFSNSGTLYSQGTTVSFGAPTIKGGVRATGTPVIDANGLLRGVTITNPGSGYSSAPTLTVTTASTRTPTATAVNGQFTLTSVSSVAGIYVGMKFDGSPGVQASTYVLAVGTNTITLSKSMTASTSSNAYSFNDIGSGQANTVALGTSNTGNVAISFISYLTTGSSAISGGDIIKQESSRRYLVRNAQGQGPVKLTAGTGTNHVLPPGQMHIIATDWSGATYYVEKLTARKATLVARTNTGTGLITLTADSANSTWPVGSAKWTMGAATGTTVTIAHYN